MATKNLNKIAQEVQNGKVKKSNEEGLMDQAGNPIFNIERKGSMVKFMNDDGTTNAMSKTEFSRTYKTEQQWAEYEEEQLAEMARQSKEVQKQANDKSAGGTNSEVAANVSEADTMAETEEVVAAVEESDENVQSHNGRLIDVVQAIANEFFEAGEMPVKTADIGRIAKHEIAGRNISLTLPYKAFNTEDKYQFITNVLHELIHAHNALHDAKDTCGGGSYHNDMFKLLMDECMLTAEKTRGQGWGNTVPTPKLVKFVESKVQLSQLTVLEVRIAAGVINSTDSNQSSNITKPTRQATRQAPAFTLNAAQVVKLYKFVTNDGATTYTTGMPDDGIDYEVVTIIDTSIQA